MLDSAARAEAFFTRKEQTNAEKAWVENKQRNAQIANMQRLRHERMARDAIRSEKVRVKSHPTATPCRPQF